MAGRIGFFIPYKWDAQNAPVDIIKINNIMYIAHGRKGPKGVTVVGLVDPNGRVLYERDLSDDGVTHIFGVTAEPSRQTNTWKLGVLTFPKDEFGTGQRTVFMEDTGVGVDWNQVAG